DLIRSEMAEAEQQELGGPLGKLREFLVDRPVQKLSWRELRRLADLTAASRIIILEDFYPQLHALSIRPDTKILQLWHACGAFKLFGLSDLGISQHLKQDTRNHRSYHAALASGEGIVPFYSEAFGVPSSHIYPVGVPRTDCFFQEEAVRQKRQNLYRRYPVLQGKRVVLFAPTFRGSGNQNADYPFELFPVHVVMENLPEDVVLVVKNHPFVRRKIEITEDDRHRVLDLTGTENINDLLLLTNVLITDYSSVIFEAAILQIPMLFYTFDLEEYIRCRDLYFDFASFAPGPIVRELPDLIQAVLDSLESPECHGLEEFREFFLGAVDGHSTERVVQLVQQLYDDGGQYHDE
nr:CDP-glycerol glycerophosphotransferase family protein [Lachnospiraceae bacterium]